MRLVGVEGAVRVLSVRVSAELLAVMEAQGTLRNCTPGSPLSSVTPVDNLLEALWSL